MSFAHIRLMKTEEDSATVTYHAQSPDFNARHEWETVAEVRIDRKTQEFAFKAVNNWAGVKVVPPEVYALPEAERERILEQRYADHGCGAWTGRILSAIRRVMSANDFPDVA